MITYVAIHDPDDNLMCPVIVCDACGERITGSGNAYWVMLPTGELHPGVWHTHKYPCARYDDVLATQAGGLVMSVELGDWLTQLTANTGATK